MRERSVTRRMMLSVACGECMSFRMLRVGSSYGIKQNYLYRVLPGLAADGLVVKEGRGWKPKDAA